MSARNVARWIVLAVGAACVAGPVHLAGSGLAEGWVLGSVFVFGCWMLVRVAGRG